MYYCESVFQGEGHPLAGTEYVSENGITTFDCGLGNCEDCNGGCSTDDFYSSYVGDCEPQECIGPTSTDTIYGCAPFWIPEDEQGDNWICEQDWSKDCFGNCSEHEDYEGACGRGSASEIIVYGDGAYSPEIQTILETYYVDNHCGIDCTGICGGESVFDECGVCGGNNSTCSGCTDIEACNYDSEAIVDDGNCDYECYGCTDIEACNYDSEANVDDGSCIYAEENYDCDGNCIVNTDCAGECGGSGYTDACGTCDDDASNDCVLGCITDNPGPFPDKNGFCRPWPAGPLAGQERLPNSLGYCKYGHLINIINIDQFDGQAVASPGDNNNYGYSVCNFDPLANTDDGSCVTRANATPLTYSLQNPWDLSNPDQQQDETKCDCFGNTFDCNDTCLSQHSAGVCSDQYLSSYWQNEDGDNVYSSQGNGVGCGILACNGNCISPDTWIHI